MASPLHPQTFWATGWLRIFPIAFLVCEAYRPELDDTQALDYEFAESSEHFLGESVEEQSYLLLMQLSANRRINGSSLNSTELIEVTDSVKKHEQFQRRYRKRSDCLAQDLDLSLRGVEADYSSTDSGYITTEVLMVAETLAALAFLLAGHQLSYVVICVTAFYFVFYLAFYSMLAIGPASWCTSPVLVGIGFGVFAGLVALWFFEKAFFVLGAAIGAIVVYFGRDTVNLLSPSTAEKSFMQMPQYVAIVAVAALIGGFITYKFQHDILAIVTSILGAYGLAVGLRTLLLQFVGYQISDLVYLVLLLAALAVGLIVQLSTANKKKD